MRRTINDEIAHFTLLISMPLGFTSDIGASADDLNLAVSLFYIPFVLLQPLSAAVGRWIGAKNWIPILMLGWGTVTIVQAFIKGRAALITMRMLIGAFEAGFYPTAVAYLSFFYPKYDLAVRIGLFYGQYAVAGAFSGSIGECLAPLLNFYAKESLTDNFLAYGIFQIPNGSLRNWQYLFIIEGSLTCLVAVIAWILLPSTTSSAWFLNEDERSYATDRVAIETTSYTQDGANDDSAGMTSPTRRDVLETAKDWKLWFVLLFNICASVPSQAFSVFLPLVVRGLGYSSIKANLVRVPTTYHCTTDCKDRCRCHHMSVGPLVYTSLLSALIEQKNAAGIL